MLRCKSGLNIFISSIVLYIWFHINFFLFGINIFIIPPEILNNVKMEGEANVPHSATVYSQELCCAGEEFGRTRYIRALRSNGFCRDQTNAVGLRLDQHLYRIKSCFIPQNAGGGVKTKSDGWKNATGEKNSLIKKQPGHPLRNSQGRPGRRSAAARREPRGRRWGATGVPCLGAARGTGAMGVVDSVLGRRGGRMVEGRANTLGPITSEDGDFVEGEWHSAQRRGASRGDGASMRASDPVLGREGIAEGEASCWMRDPPTPPPPRWGKRAPEPVLRWGKGGWGGG